MYTNADAIVLGGLLVFLLLAFIVIWWISRPSNLAPAIPRVYCVILWYKPFTEVWGVSGQMDCASAQIIFDKMNKDGLKAFLLEVNTRV